jgi:hypothetical protein
MYFCGLQQKFGKKGIIRDFLREKTGKNFGKPEKNLQKKVEKREKTARKIKNFKKNKKIFSVVCCGLSGGNGRESDVTKKIL